AVTPHCDRVESERRRAEDLDYRPDPPDDPVAECEAGRDDRWPGDQEEEGRRRRPPRDDPRSGDGRREVDECGGDHDREEAEDIEPGMGGLQDAPPLAD